MKREVLELERHKSVVETKTIFEYKYYIKTSTNKLLLTKSKNQLLKPTGITHKSPYCTIDIVHLGGATYIIYNLNKIYKVEGNTIEKINKETVIIGKQTSEGIEVLKISPNEEEIMLLKTFRGYTIKNTEHNIVEKGPLEYDVLMLEEVPYLAFGGLLRGLVNSDICRFFTINGVITIVDLPNIEIITSLPNFELAEVLNTGIIVKGENNRFNIIDRYEDFLYVHNYKILGNFLVGTINLKNPTRICIINIPENRKQFLTGVEELHYKDNYIVIKTIDRIVIIDKHKYPTELKLNKLALEDVQILNDIIGFPRMDLSITYKQLVKSNTTQFTYPQLINTYYETEKRTD